MPSTYIVLMKFIHIYVILTTALWENTVDIYFFNKIKMQSR